MKVIIPKHIHEEIDFYVQRSPIEVSGLGRVKKHDNGDMEVVKVYLLEQENTAASTDIDEKAVTKLMFESRMDEGDLNFWWHSHVNMGVFWSGTDMATIKDFGSNGYLLSTVFNKKGEMRSSYYQGATDFLPCLFMDKLETVIGNVANDELRDKWEAEYKAKCKRPKPVYHPPAYLQDRYGWGETEQDIWEKPYYGREIINPVPKKPKPKRGDKRKGRKGKTNAQNKSSILGGEVRTTTLANFLNEADVREWRCHLGDLWNEPMENISDEDLLRFYHTWDGDFNAMSSHVINQIIERDLEEGIVPTKSITGGWK